MGFTLRGLRCSGAAALAAVCASCSAAGSAAGAGPNSAVPMALQPDNPNIATNAQILMFLILFVRAYIKSMLANGTAIISAPTVFGNAPATKRNEAS